jgi:hypothetical protein
MKDLGTGAQAGERRLTEQTARRIDAQKLAQLQAKEVSGKEISDIGDNLRFEEKVLSEKQSLKNKQRTHEFEAVNKHAETMVARLEGEAKQKGEYAEWIAQLAPKAAKALGQVVQGGLSFADKLHGINEWNKAQQNGNLKKKHDGESEVINQLTKNINTDQIKLTEIGATEEANNLNDTVRFSSYWAQRKFLSHVKNNKNGYINEILASFGFDDPKQAHNYNEYSAHEILDFGARQLLDQLGISQNSEVGSDIIEQFQTWGNTAADGFFKDRKVDETKTRNKENLENWRNAKPKDKQLMWETMVLGRKNGWYSTNGRINDPRKGETMSYGEASIAVIKEDLLGRISAKDGPRLTSWDDALELYGGILTVKRKPTDKQEVVVDKFRGLLEEKVRPLFEAEVKRVKGLNDKAKETEDGLGLIKLQTEIKGLKEGEYTNEWKYKKALSIFNNPDITNKDQFYEELFGNDYSGWKAIDKFVEFNRAVADGDEFTAQKIISDSSNLDEKAKLHIEQTNKTLKIIRDQDPGGWAGVTDKQKKFMSTQAGSVYQWGKGSTNISGDLATNFLLARVWDRVKGGESLSNAIDAEQQLVREAVAKPGDESIKETNPYHITPSSGGLPGTKPAANFTHFTDTDTKNNYLLRNYLLSSDSEKSATAWRNLQDIDIITLDPMDIKYGLINKNQTPDELIGSGRVVPQSYVESVKRAVLRIREDGDATSWGIPTHPGLTAFAEAAGWSETRSQNYLLHKYFPNEDYRIPEESQDVSIVKNNNIFVNQRDVLGYDYYNACKAQNCLPMKDVVRFSTEEGLGISESWSKSTGIVVDYSMSATSNFSEFIKKGGLNLPEMSEEFLIQNGLFKMTLPNGKLNPRWVNRYNPGGK